MSPKSAMITEWMSPLQKTAHASMVVLLCATFCCAAEAADSHAGQESTKVSSVIVHHATKFDVSPPFASARRVTPAQAPEPKSGACCRLSSDLSDTEQQSNDPAPAPKPVITDAGAAVEQRVQGKKPASVLVESFDGLGAGFSGPNGVATFKNPSDNSLAVGPNHIVQIVNTRLAVYTKAGARYGKTGEVLYGPVATNNLWAGFGGVCEARNNGDGVVRYDQLARRWLFVMPIFTRVNPGEFPAGHGEPAHSGEPSNHGPAATLPPNPPPPPPPVARKPKSSGSEAE